LVVSIDTLESAAERALRESFPLRGGGSGIAPVIKLGNIRGRLVARAESGGSQG
jgi:hypothetical protein